jgi:hypothetical protein
MKRWIIASALLLMAAAAAPPHGPDAPGLDALARHCQRRGIHHRSPVPEAGGADRYDITEVGDAYNRSIYFVNHGDRSIEAFGIPGRLWKTEAIGCGGFRGLDVDGEAFIGEARRSSEPEEWARFSVSLRTGEVSWPVASLTDGDASALGTARGNPRTGSSECAGAAGDVLRRTE